MMLSIFQTASGSWHITSILMAAGWFLSSIITGIIIFSQLVANRAERVATFEREQETESKISTLGASHKKLKTESDKLKQQQKRTLDIKLMIDKIKNGSRPAYNELDQINTTYPDLTSEERGIIAEGYSEFRRELEKYILSKSSARLLDSAKQSRKWSLEYLYDNLVYEFDIDVNIAAANEIGNRKHEYLVEELYDIAVNNENIFLSVIACQAICKITDYAPYKRNRRKDYPQQTPDKQLIYDAPKLKYLKEWWEDEGKKDSKYLCPFHNFVDNHRIDLYYDRENNSEAAKRLEEIDKILTIYPKLARTRGEVAYLLLEDESTFNKVEENALEALKETDMEPLPYLLRAYIAFKRHQPDNFYKLIDSAIRLTGKDKVAVCLQINKKLNILINPVSAYLHDNNL